MIHVLSSFFITNWLLIEKFLSLSAGGFCPHFPLAREDMSEGLLDVATPISLKEKVKFTLRKQSRAQNSTTSVYLDLRINFLVIVIDLKNNHCFSDIPLHSHL